MGKKRKKPVNRPLSVGDSSVRLKLIEERYEAFRSILNALIKMVELLRFPLCIFFVTYYGIYRPIEVSSGSETTIKYLVGFVESMTINISLAWSLTISSVLWAVGERKLRHREKKKKEQRISQLELVINGNVASTGMDSAEEK